MATDIIANLIAGTKKQNSAVSENMSLKFSSNTDFKGKTFDSLLTNATKSYADTVKTSPNTFNSSNYAQKTKDINSSKTNNNSKIDYSTKETKNNQNISKPKDNNTDSTKVENQSNKNSSNNINNQQDKTEIKDNNNKIDEKDTSKEIETNKETQKTDNSEKTEDTKNENSSETTEKDNSQNSEKEENLNNEANGTDQQNETQNTVSKNTIANEQIIANIEYTSDKNILDNQNTVISQTQQTSTDDALNTNNQTVDNKKTQQSVQQIKTTENAAKINLQTPIQNTQNIAEEVIQSVVETVETTNLENTVQNNNTNKNQNTQQIQTQISLPEENQTTTTNNISDIDLNIDIDNVNAQKINTETTTNAPLKTAKENLAADSSRIVLNIDDTAQNTENNKVITPTTKPENTNTQNAEPLIKITDEVASQTKQNENLPVNKDITGTVKDKAVATMTNLQETNTVVTQSQTTGQNQAQTNSNQNNNAATKNNAAEQVIKFSVDNTTSTNSTPAESFLGKLDAKLNLSAKSAPQNTLLNKSDIMSQMNTKFSELAQNGQNKVSMILQPENLGKVTVEIISSKDGIVAKMTTENHHVKELFDKNMDALKSSLGAQGVNVNNIKVECTNESSNNAMNFEREQFNQSNFNNSHGQNRQTHNSDQNTQSSYTNEFTSTEEQIEETTNNIEIKNTNTIIKHNGKVDYTV